MSINIHFIIALIILVLSETIGLWLVNTHLIIPAQRLEAANWVYQFSILAFLVTVVSVLKVLIVGVGIGGLATALRLAKKGYTVEIIEKNAQVGGRLNQIKKDRFTFDTGPSFFSMSYEFEQLAKDCNIKLPFTYFDLDPLYTVNFIDNPKTYFLYKDIKKLAEQFKDVEPDF